MTTISIPLSDERLSQLRKWAEQAGLAPEELLRRHVEQLLDRPDGSARACSRLRPSEEYGAVPAAGMIRYLALQETLELHRRVLEQTGGLDGVRDPGLLDSALAQPRMTFDGVEFMGPTIADKAAALAFSLIANHPFNDGNKRVGHAAMETFLVLNGHELSAGVDEQERVILRGGGRQDDAGKNSRLGWIHTCNSALICRTNS